MEVELDYTELINYRISLKKIKPEENQMKEILKNLIKNQVDSSLLVQSEITRTIVWLQNQLKQCDSERGLDNYDRTQKIIQKFKEQLEQNLVPDEQQPKSGSKSTDQAKVPSTEVIQTPTDQLMYKRNLGIKGIQKFVSSDLGEEKQQKIDEITNSCEKQLYERALQQGDENTPNFNKSYESYVQNFCQMLQSKQVDAHKLIDGELDIKTIDIK